MRLLALGIWLVVMALMGVRLTTEPDDRWECNQLTIEARGPEV